LARPAQETEGASELASVLRQERDTLQAIMEATHTHMAYLDTEFNFLWVNSAYALGSGYSQEELIGRNHFALFPDPENQAIFERVKETGQSAEFHAKPLEYADQPERGITYWDWSLVPIIDKERHLQGLLLSLLEVTEHQRAKQSLERALQRARQSQAETSALSAVSRAILRYREFEPTARLIFDSCTHLTGATAGYVALLSADGTEDDILFWDAGGAADTATPTLALPVRGLHEQVYRTSKALYENDLSGSEWTELSLEVQGVVDNVLFAPLLVDGIAVGLLGLVNKAGGFTEDDVRIASAFSELAALALLQSRTLETLQTSEESFRAVAQSAGDAILTVDGHNRIRFWNRAAERIFGYSREEAVGQSLGLIVPKRFLKAHRAGMWQMASTGALANRGRTVEVVGLRRGGTEFPIELSLATWRTKEGAFVTGIVRDITERVRVEDAQRASEARWHSLVDNAPNFITIVNREGIVEFINHTVPGITVKDVVGKSVYDFVQPDHRDLARRKVESVFQTGETDGYVSAALGPDGTVAWYENQLGPIVQDAQVIAVTIIAADITERVRMEEALRERTNELGERVKELSCLYGISRLVQRPGTTLQEILQGTANLIPAAWQYPEITCARILLDGQGFESSGFVEAAWNQTADIVVRGDRVGAVEVCYLERRPDGSEGPFLEEERSLLDAIAGRLGRIAEWKQAEELLRNQNQFITTVFESLAHPFYVIDADDYTVKMANSAAITGDWPRAVTCHALTHQQGTPCDGVDHLCPIEEIRRTKRPAVTEHVHYNTEGDRRIYQVHAHPILEAEGKVSQVIEYTLDITERVRAEEALRNARDELERRVLERTAALAMANDELQEAVARNEALYEAERQARHLAEILSAASQALTQTLDLDAVMDTLLEYLHRLVPYDSASFALPQDERRFVVRAVRGFGRWDDPQDMLGTTLDVQTNPCIDALLTAQKSIVIPDTGDRAGWQHCARSAQNHSWLGLPLVAGDKVIGLCTLEKGEADFFTPQHVQSAEALVSQAAVAVQNAWLFEQVRAGRERQRSLSRRLVEVQETERRYVSRELHDEAGQALTSLLVGLRLLEREAEHPEAIVAGVAELERRVAAVLEDLHRLAADLRPASLDHLGLVAALRQYAEAISDKHGLVVQFEAVGFDDRLPPDVETALYRIVQESLTNVIRHARATRADVLLQERDDKLIVVIEDNGVGCDTAAAAHSGRLGLFGMRERAEMLGGTLVLESAGGAGTTVLLEVPYADPDTHRR
jgi:PAS domain S-box-containing protein